jgi:hypothetical protein
MLATEVPSLSHSAHFETFVAAFTRLLKIMTLSANLAVWRETPVGKDPD